MEESNLQKIWCGDRRLELRGGFGIGLWKDIRKDWDTFSHYGSFVVWDERRLSFGNE